MTDIPTWPDILPSLIHSLRLPEKEFSFAVHSTSEPISLQGFVEFEMVRRRKIVSFDPRYLEFQGMPSLAFAIFVIGSVSSIISESLG